MSREHHGKAAGADPHAGSHAPSHADHEPGPGKNPAAQEALLGEDAGDEPVATAARATPAHLRKTVRNKYLPTVKHYKELAVEEMRNNFAQSEKAGTSFLATAIKAVAAGAGAALATAAGGGVLVSALAAGAAETASDIADSFGSKGSIDPNEFCSRYAARLDRKWFHVKKHVLGAMDDEASAREVHAHMKFLFNHDGVVRREMREELLDAWVNALRYQNMENRPGVGSKSFNDPTEGRLHLGTFELDIEKKQSAPLTTPSTKATMEGTPGPAARNVDLHRKLDDMRIARTFRVHWNGYGVNGNVNLGVAPGQHQEIDQLAADESIDKFAMASYFVGRRLDRDDAGPLEGGNDQKEIDAKWRSGMRHIWSFFRDRTVAQLHIHSIGA
jgi:hypothetical protein